jgi:hypothetical protein
MTHDRRHVGHSASLRLRIGAQIQLLRIKNVQGTVLSQPSTQNRGPTQGQISRAPNVRTARDPERP